MNSVKKSLLSEKTTLAALFLSIGMLLVYSCIKNPLTYTISIIGLSHPYMFFALCIVMSFTNIINLHLFFQKVGYKSKLFSFLTYFANVIMLIAPLTVSQEYVPIRTPMHWIAAFVFMIVNPLIILRGIFYASAHGNKKYNLTTVIFTFLYLADVAAMIICFSSAGAMEGKNGLLEIVPILLTFTLLLLFNHTHLFDAEKISAPDKSDA